MATLVTKNSSTAAAVPGTGDLVQGELAVNVTDKRLFTKNAGGSVVEVGTNPSSLVVTGDVGIGTSPSTKLHLAGAAFRHNDATGSYGYTVTTASSKTVTAALFGGGYFAWQTNNSGTDQLTLDSSGNLGLGVTPSAWNAFWKNIQVTSASFGGSGAIVNYATMASNIFSDGASYLSNAKYIASGTATAYIQNAGAHQWHTAPSGTAGNAITFTQAMTLDASGNLGIGISSPQAVLHVNKATTSTFRLSATNVGIDIQSLDGAGYGLVSTYTNHPMVFSTNANERARITSGGDLLVGTTTAGAGAGFSTRLAIDAGAADAAIFKTSGGVSASPARCWNSATTGDNLFLLFATEGTYTGRGSIDYNRAGGLVRYNTTSDYRAKDIIGPVQNPGATIDALKVYEGVMKGATQSRPMLIAHEAQEHAPYAVSGVKDEVNEDGTPKFQQMDVSSLVPLLLAEIQSLRARVAALEAV